ncbi:hypothetical protein [Listeria booriae]|uniref:hypothetical protein n=1 Tax=Listeria booriae TaxID=1552123 RepID=UPI001628F5F2|nr:hypothetical protein [Listeria booriae]MBC2168670.1 hypothetical protein [Listeria booriae]
MLDIIRFNFNELKEEDGLEELYERCLYLMRTAKDLCQKAYADLSDDDNDIFPKAYLDGLFYPLHVNYANALSETGRYVKSISTLQSISKSNYPMAVGNLALKIINYSYFDRSHQSIMFCNTNYLLSYIIDDDVKFPEKEYAIRTFEEYFKHIENSLGLEYLNKPYNLNDFLILKEDDSNAETKYREWFSYNRLSLNQLNDIYIEKEVGYDPLHLPSMILDRESTKIPKYHGIFNLIKQEYVSARFTS